MRNLEVGVVGGSSLAAAGKAACAGQLLAALRREYAFATDEIVTYETVRVTE